MARRRLEGLERVLGANALFSTAYGNVGSSIYYALGLVASYALGLTPVVFVIAGIFLAGPFVGVKAGRAFRKGIRKLRSQARTELTIQNGDEKLTLIHGAPLLASAS